MKGDEVVKEGEEGSDRLLLGHVRNAQWKHLCWAERKVLHRAAGSSNLYVTPYLGALKCCLEELAIEVLAFRCAGV